MLPSTNEPQIEIGRRIAQTYPSAAVVERIAPPKPWPALGQPSRATAILEMALSLSGIGLSGFMFMHLGLLFSVLLRAATMDTLAAFLERYYLLQIGAPLLVVIGAVHMFAAARKVPTAFARQRALLRHLRALRHLDSWTWVIQILTGTALLALAAIHLWVVLTDLPIQAAKSGGRVFEIYLWFYVPFVLLVETHISLGIYRVAVKWGISFRHVLHWILLSWTVVVLALGFAILATFYWVGGNL